MEPKKSSSQTRPSSICTSMGLRNACLQTVPSSACVLETEKRIIEFPNGQREVHTKHHKVYYHVCSLALSFTSRRPKWVLICPTPPLLIVSHVRWHLSFDIFVLTLFFWFWSLETWVSRRYRQDSLPWRKNRNKIQHRKTAGERSRRARTYGYRWTTTPRIKRFPYEWKWTCSRYCGGNVSYHGRNYGSHCNVTACRTVYLF